MRQITTYDKIEVIDIDKAKDQKPFYTIKDRSISLIDGLSPIHFIDKLYTDVTQGSKRWWVLERRKYDYSKFYSKRNSMRVTREIVDQHELGWIEKVSDFYAILDDGYVVKEEINSNHKIPSPYLLKTHIDGGEIISDLEAKKIGYDEDGNPLFFTVSRDADGIDVDVSCKVTFDDVKYGGGVDCQRGSLRWWLIERMRFDFGNKHRPLIKGQHNGDWRGVVKRFHYDGDGHLRLKDVDIIALQQEAWERYIDARREYLSSYHPTSEEIDSNNIYRISMMSEQTLIDMCHQAPDILYKYIPSYLYSKVVCNCLDRAGKENRLNINDSKKISTLKNIIKYIRTNPDEDTADNISMRIISRCQEINPDDYIVIIRLIVLKAIAKGLINREYQNTLFNIIRSISIKSVGRLDPAFESMEWLSVYCTALHEAFCGREERMKKFCSRNGLVP